MRNIFRCAFAPCVGMFSTHLHSSVFLLAGIAIAALMQPVLAASLVDAVPGPVTYNNSFVTIANGGTTGPYANISGPGTTSLTYFSSQIQSVISLSPSPSLSLSGTASGSASNGTSGNPVGVLNVTYNFVVQGPSGAVPITVTGSGSEGGTSTGVDANFNSLDAALQVSGPGVSLLNYFPNGQPGSFTLNNTSNYQANQSYQIQMIAEGGANAGFGGSASFFANVDPVFTINPTFANASEYSLVFSPGVGNSLSVVPLPSTWGMMLMGLVSLGFIAYRQKSKPALLAAA
jgi:hypothetical protein